MDVESIQRKLEELQLIQYSLLPSEHLTFADDLQGWSSALELYCEDPTANLPILHDAPVIAIHVDGAKMRFELTLATEVSGTLVSVRGEDITRNNQERWQTIIAEKMDEISDSEFPIYQLISLHLLPLLHEEIQASEMQQTDTQSAMDAPPSHPSRPFHVLFTSHHLKAPSKRRSLQKWSSSLSLSGFAKVGHPGVIYAQGYRGNIEEFVDNVKSMQWLALKVRFFEPLPVYASTGEQSLPESSWTEFQKVGEVVEEMRRLGREECVVEMGIGSADPFLPIPLLLRGTRPDLIDAASSVHTPLFLLDLDIPRMSTSLGFRISRGALTTIAPPIPRAYEWASRYNATSAHPLLDMSQGVPGIPPPEVVQTALGAAASSPTSFGYSRWDGEPNLRQALAGEMKVVYGEDTDIQVNDVALTSGCNLAFVAVAMSVADPGDEVILPVPWYFNHQMTLNLLGIKTVALKTRPEDRFTPSVERCRELITPNTKAIVLVTPNNPTGATYSSALIASFASLARDSNVALIVDETYRDFIVTGAPPHNLFSSSNPDPWRSTFIHLFSFSKSYCLPGHRLGAIVASPFFLSSVRSVLDTLQICPPRPIQLALAPLLPSLRAFVADTAARLHSRHALFKVRLPPKWRVGAQGGYFAFVRHPFARVRAGDVSRRLAEEIGVVSLPSSFFSEEKMNDAEEKRGIDWKALELPQEVEEDERWIRFSVANVDDEKVEKVCERLGASESAFNWRVSDDI